MATNMMVTPTADTIPTEIIKYDWLGKGSQDPPRKLKVEIRDMNLAEYLTSLNDPYGSSVYTLDIVVSGGERFRLELYVKAEYQLSTKQYDVRRSLYICTRTIVEGELIKDECHECDIEEFRKYPKFGIITFGCAGVDGFCD